MKLIIENWKKFLNESATGMINTVRGKEEVEIALFKKKPIETDNWFVWSNRSRSRTYVYVTHKATGNKIDNHLWEPKYGKTLGAARKLINDLEKNLDLPDISSPEGLSRESQRAILDFLNVDVVNEQIDDEQLKKLGFDEAPEIISLLKNLDGEDSLPKIAKSLKDAGIKPEELGDKLQQIEDFQSKFEDFLKSEKEKQQEMDREADKGSKEGSRAAIDDENSAKAQTDQL